MRSIISPAWASSRSWRRSITSGGEAIIKLVDVIESRNRLGENALWHAGEGRLWWTDIEGSRLHRYDPQSRALETTVTPERLCSFAFRQGGGLIAAFETGLALYDPGTATHRWLHRREPCAHQIRSNDGRCDRDGRFWFGTMAEPEGRPAVGKLYRLDRDGSLAIEAEGIGIVNTLSFSPDGRRLYFADSPQRTIFVCDLDRDDGRIANRRLFAETPPGAYPDGATVDSDGCLWNAHWNAGCIVRYAPDGRIVESAGVPASLPTCVAFGGEKLNHLFVTTACEGINKDAIIGEPEAGHLFIYETDATGLPDAEYVFEGTK